MIYNPLGHSDIKISRICLGTMTWGEQNTQQEAFAQMEMALDYGVNFWDTAELYAVPPRAETYGATETIIGNWLTQSGRRDEIVLASKIAGPGEFVRHIRGGSSRFNREQIHQALEGSLKRLQTDYLDLYQLHWPERSTNYFGQLGFTAPSQPEDTTDFEETLDVLSELVKEGKIRQIGISNETPWATMKYLQIAEAKGLQKIISVQNPYSLLNRSYEVGMAEIAYQENVQLLAYSPLGFGVLSGKYLNGQGPANARITLYPHYDRYLNENAVKATQAYADLAHDHNLTPTQLALAFVNSRPFVAANIIGATTLEQLKENIESIDVTLSETVLQEIEQIHSQYPIPAP
ncbi:MAG: NADP(H)-dependent aldo-keto reductase [Thiomicrorhabdus chilensis]|uniref:NADP(H)-dependent aldo-keto reductase n=1 Tax=Thiomicrorhabdus chilensis TaxID=63656 RepID=UPI00299E9DCB|nr:NADP(H)-dependent aldo-keto reductase [Thiomicrorhabdus chilensis]MDX1347492.1 NADP(H)-dependent aldo-keto reductase [Thiomicrorhabdus chilensis]